MMKMQGKARNIIWFEPIVFLFFGLLHLHRIWALIDRAGYADYWLSLMMNRGPFYFALMGTMAALCVAGVVIFVMNRGKNVWWRWFYMLGGGYVPFFLLFPS